MNSEVLKYQTKMTNKDLYLFLEDSQSSSKFDDIPLVLEII